MPGARRARSLACSVENTRVSHHGHTGLTRHSPRNGFNGFLRALLGDRAFFVTVVSGVASANLTPASGRQDHTTSPSALASFVSDTATSTASRPASVTIASRPSEGRDGEDIILIWVRREAIFRKFRIRPVPLAQRAPATHT